MVQDAVKRALHSDAPIPAGLIEVPAADAVTEDAAPEAAAEETAADAPSTDEKE